ncbi:hypothetical protein J6590_062492 [Homalodisca vitripennis]|nr:hypothetical protein J6590_062492 [Homalodisca vitripennis]
MPVTCKGARHPNSAPVKGQFYVREQDILIVPLSNASSVHPNSAPVKRQFCVREQGILIVPLSNASSMREQGICWARHLNSAPVLMPVLCKGAWHPNSAPVKRQFCGREQGILIVPLSNASSV